MAVPLTKACPECEEEMDLITADDVGEVLVYECPECGYQEETHVQTEEAERDDLRFPDGPHALDDEDANAEGAEPGDPE